MSRVFGRVLIATLLLVLSACQVDIAIDIDVAENGGGTVTVDTRFDAAADEALASIASQLRIDDLEGAGWDVATVQADDGSTGVSATKGVAGPDDWQPVLDEIAGPGVFTAVRVTARDEFANVSQQLTFELDLDDGWELFSDEGVAQALDGELFGAPIESLTDGRALDEIISVTIDATVVSNDDGTPAVGSYTARFDSDEPLRVVLGSTTENSTAVLLRWIAIALFSLFALATVLAVTGIVLQRRSDRIRPAPTPASLASRVPGASSTTPVSVPADAIDQNESVRLVIVEPLSVLYQQGHPVEESLLPFVREQGSTARADTILEGYRSLVAGSTETDAFWELCGVTADPASVDDRYVAQRVLRPGAATFFKEMQRRRIPVAATTNDASLWSKLTRDRDRLSAVWPWLVSADVGTTTTNVGMFEILRRESGVAHGHCLYVDTDIESLDAARELGMKTALFDTGDLDLPAVVGHPVVTDFKSLFGS